MSDFCTNGSNTSSVTIAIDKYNPVSYTNPSNNHSQPMMVPIECHSEHNCFMYITHLVIADFSTCKSNHLGARGMVTLHGMIGRILETPKVAFFDHTW